jgi:hypothetical protein
MSTMQVIEEVEDARLEPSQSVMAILDRSGDTKMIWDRRKRAEVDNAQATFDRLKKEGYAAYRVKSGKGLEGERGEVMKSFDSEAERMIMVPPLVGG